MVESAKENHVEKPYLMSSRLLTADIELNKKVILMTYEARLESEDKVLSLFQPDLLLADQYLQTFQQKLTWSPKKKLMFAVLEDAIFCFQKYCAVSHRRGKNLFQETEQWILEEDGDCLYSFSNVCWILGIDASYLRQGLLRWKRWRLAQCRKPTIPKELSLDQIRFSTEQRQTKIVNAAEYRQRKRTDGFAYQNSDRQKSQEN